MRFWFALCQFSAGITAGISVGLATSNPLAGILAGFALISTINALAIAMPDSTDAASD